ncbi:MAG TPA: hypothetical protein VFV19_19875 [Candidatus Polarisedimenticolaceae bacterium]|nr:hypothetical protein [Candidatus Polarisedimenticolaceae bacterium]
MKRIATLAILAVAVGAGTPSRAVNTCFTYTPGHVYYVAYQNNPPGQEYIIDLGDRTTFLNATTMLTLPDISAGDFSTIFPGTTANLWVGFFGVSNPSTRDALISTNGPKDDTQLGSSSIIGAANQVDSWATGIPQFSSEVGSAPCHLNAARFPGNVFGSYQQSLNGSGQGSLSGQVVWNVETRLSSSTGVRTQTAKIHFDSAVSNPSGSSRGYVGYFVVFTDGTADFWPDDDGDFLPDVAPGSDPNADLCPGVNSTNNTDADGDLHAAPCDCNEADNTVWAIPAEVQFSGFASNKSDETWAPPADPGSTHTVYDLLKATFAGTNPAFSCFASSLSVTTASDPTTPSTGGLFLYLVRARTSCGAGTVGQGHNGPVRNVPASCP